jgi:hypothetical protein
MVFLWLRDNWFPVLQTIGIMGGLLFTAVSIRQSTNARKTSDLLALTEQHRQLWNEVYSRPELGRIYSEGADLIAAPVTITEERFLNEVIVHFQTGWQLACQGSLITLDAMRADARTFFKLPIPRHVWRQTKAGREEKFVKFVEDCLVVPGSSSPTCC